MKKLIALVAVFLFAFSTVFAKKAKQDVSEESTSKIKITKKSKLKPIKLGIEKDEQLIELWTPAKNILVKEGIDLQIVLLEKETSVDQALIDGEIDLFAGHKNLSLQHAVANIYFEPLCLCSKKITELSTLKQGDSVAIPSEADECARALKLLASSGLIKLYSDAGDKPTLGDIQTNKKGINFKRVSASSISTVLDNVKIAVLAKKEALSCGVQKENIFFTEESVESSKWNVVFCCNEDSIDEQKNEMLQKVVKAFQSEQTCKVMEETFMGSIAPVGWN